MIKADPTGSAAVLRVNGHQAAFRSGPDSLSKAIYALETVRGSEVLDGVQWAEWSNDGRLIVATNDGRLQIRVGGDVTWELDVSGHIPNPMPAPDVDTSVVTPHSAARRALVYRHSAMTSIGPTIWVH